MIWYTLALSVLHTTRRDQAVRANRRARQARRFLFCFAGGDGPLHPLAAPSHAPQAPGRAVVVALAAAMHTMTIFEREAAPQLDPTRQHWGLPPDLKLASLYRYLYLAYSPPSFSLRDVGVVAGQVVGRPGTAAAIPSTTHFIR